MKSWKKSDKKENISLQTFALSNLAKLVSVFDICTFKFLCEERKEPSTVNCHTSIVSLSERRDGFESMNPALWCYKISLNFAFVFQCV